MQKKLSKGFFYLGSAAACTILAFATGCASGGYSLTRKYAQFVNSQPLILRIVLYILTFVVFAVTLLIDMVVYNTIDFWNGRVSAGSYQFQGDNKTFYVEHTITPDHLKRSTIQVMGPDNKLLQTVVFSETTQHEVELFVDGQLKARGQDINNLPKLSLFDAYGKQTDQILNLENVAAR